jgi:hypothetical protein
MRDYICTTHLLDEASFGKRHAQTLGATVNALAQWYDSQLIELSCLATMHTCV